MTILVTGANGQLGNEMRIVAKDSKDRYIFTDVCDEHTESIEILHKLAGDDIDISTTKLDITNLDAIREMVNHCHRMQVYDRIAPSIEDWLSGIANSEFMIVDSFHATVFCILFHKNFVTIANEARGLSRFSSLLKMVGLEDRLIINRVITRNDIQDRSIDWNLVEERIERFRNKSKGFLLDALQMDEQ